MITIIGLGAIQSSTKCPFLPKSTSKYDRSVAVGRGAFEPVLRDEGKVGEVNEAVAIDVAGRVWMALVAADASFIAAQVYHFRS